MILVRSPLRITLGGGGTDLEPYCSEHGGFCLAAAINKYVYVAVTKPFTPGIFLKYSEIEHVQTVDEVRHPIVHRALALFDVEPQIEITTLADIPAGTGLGSSSSFTTALLAALCVHTHQRLSTQQLAETAIGIEKQTGITGRQDQYIAAYGGLGVLTFGYDSFYKRLQTNDQALNDRLLLFDTGVTHCAADVLTDQGTARTNLDCVKQCGHDMRAILEAHEFDRIGRQLDYQWAQKEDRCGSSARVHALRQIAMSAGARGVKLIGAGVGGFLLCDTDMPTPLRHAMAANDAAEVRYQWDYEGTKTLLS